MNTNDTTSPEVGGYITVVTEHGYIIVSLPLTGEGE